MNSGRELRRPGRAETLLLAASLVAAGVVVTLGLAWGSEADGWQVAIEVAASGVFCGLFGLFLRERGERRPWLLPVIAFVVTFFSLVVLGPA